jgi:uncharacterized protein (TIGR00369 family)
MNSKFPMDECCFACGAKNDQGLKLNISGDAKGVRAAIKAPQWAQGYSGVVHGGIIATILDELAVWAVFKRGYKSVTAELVLRIRNVMKVGQTYTAHAHVVDTKYRLIQAESRIVGENEELIASATVKLLRVK